MPVAHGMPNRRLRNSKNPTAFGFLRLEIRLKPPGAVRNQHPLSDNGQERSSSELLCIVSAVCLQMLSSPKLWNVSQDAQGPCYSVVESCMVLEASVLKQLGKRAQSNRCERLLTSSSWRQATTGQEGRTILGRQRRKSKSVGGYRQSYCLRPRQKGQPCCVHSEAVCRPGIRRVPA